ncbi:MAG TPA: hypothetical protein VGT03_03700 [Candidatus Acidoferrales bacterium]|nr:hypothetical protein [Candidatus Acidoferrales bacterium]
MTRYWLLAGTLALAIPAAQGQTQRKDVGDRTSYFRDIVIQPDESADDVICFDCSVRVLGEVRDDIVILALEAIPRAGFFVLAVAAWLSMGAAIVSRFGSRPREVKRTFAPTY